MELGIGARGKKTRIMGLPYGHKSFKIGLDTIPTCDRWTDIHSMTAKAALTYSVTQVKEEL